MLKRRKFIGEFSFIAENSKMVTAETRRLPLSPRLVFLQILCFRSYMKNLPFHNALFYILLRITRVLVEARGLLESKVQTGAVLYRKHGHNAIAFHRNYLFVGINIK